MSLALYRRYRPESFAEVIGQEHVTDPLQQALRNNRVNHAYLFSGPRGCGKTTSARILARCLNCEQGPTPTPCGACQSCRDLARNGPGSIDVIEIDAASHGGVDDARDLREKAFFGPAASRYKIYIIDEAHMVTSAGFNALLKVVEEPPEHLKFIFATTEPEKVIGTIRSRTHHYPFRLVPPGTLRDYLAQVCERESIPVEDGVYPLVVRSGAGSVRDSMSVMDQLLAGAGESGVTYAMATALLGYTDGALLDDVVDAFAAGDGGAAFEVVDRVIEGGHDPRRFVADLLERLRDLVILAAVPDAGEKGLIDAPADVVERMAAQAAVFGAAELSRAADLVNAGLTEMRGATSPRLQLELICARVLLPAAYDDERAVQARLDRLERQALAGGPVGYAPEAGGHAPGPGAHGAVSDGPAAARAAMRPAGAAPAAQPAPVPPPAQATPETGPPVTTPPGAWPPASGPGGQSAPASGGQPGSGAHASGSQSAPASGAQASAPASESRVPGAWPAAGQGPGERGDGSGGGAGTGAGEAAAVPAPGAWPGGTRSGSGGGADSGAPRQGQGAGRAPGAWPTAAAPGAATSAPPPAQPLAPAPAAAQAQPTASGDPSRVRQMWPDILEAVKNRRRFTWILLSQNAQVVGFDGSTLQVGFSNPGARDSFVSGGSEDVLRQAITDTLHVEWRIEAIVDPSGGGSAPGGGPPSPGGGPGPRQPTPAPASGAASGQPARATQPPSQPRSQPPAQSQAHGAAHSTPEAPPRVAIEDDIPEEDNPDLDDTALTGHDLIVRELGATVIEEIVAE